MKKQMLTLALVAALAAAGAATPVYAAAQTDEGLVVGSTVEDKIVGQVTVTASNAVVRSLPASSATQVAELEKGVSVAYVDYQSGWYCVRLGKKSYGWVAGSAVEAAPVAKSSGVTKISVTTQPVNVIGVKSDEISFIVEAKGSGLSYIWQISDDNGKTWRNTSTTASIYTTILSEARDGRLVRCAISNPYGITVLSGAASMKISEPQIITQPTNVYGKNGGEVYFKVYAVGEGLTYQWQISDDNGATWRNTSTKTAKYGTVLTPAREDRLVRCIVTDKYGAKATSKAATMKISSVTVTTQPTSVVAKAGSTVTFKAEGVGEGLTYQWQLSDDNGKTWRDSKVKTATYSATVTNANSGRLVRCVLTDKYGTTATTKAASMTVTSLAIAKQPSAVTANAGSTVSFNIKAVGAVAYEWQLSDDQGKSWRSSKIAGDTYATTLTNANSGRYVRCVVTDIYGNTLKSDATYMKVTSLKITKQPVSVTAKSGSTVTFKVAASGPSVTYQWQLSDDQGKTWRNSKITTANYSATLTDANSGRYVRCVVTDKYGNSVKSDVAYMKVSSLKITGQPADATGALGDTVTVKVTAGGPSVTYQWQLSDDNGKTWRNSSVKTASYSVVLSETNNGRLVRCVVTDKYGNSVKSNAATLKVKAAE